MWFLVCSKSLRYVRLWQGLFLFVAVSISVCLMVINSVSLEDGGGYFPRNVGKHLPDYIASRRKIAAGGRDGWVMSWRFKRKRSWSYRGKTRNFPVATGETQENCQYIQCPRRHSNSAFLEYKSDLLLHLFACLEEWSNLWWLLSCGSWCRIDW